MSREALEQRGIVPRSIANEEVQNLRKRIYVWDFAERQYRPLHSYVPFYFARQTPMLRNQYQRGIKSKIIVFEARRAFLAASQVLFTDGNASMQQLSKFAGEIVQITPMTPSNKACLRKYLPADGPRGTNQRCSNFYSDPIFLDQISWDVIYRKTQIEFEEYKRLVHAEALFPDRFPMDKIQDIVVGTRDMMDKVNMLLKEPGYHLPVSCRPGWFSVQ